MSPFIHDSHHTNINTMHTTFTFKLLKSINEAYNKKKHISQYNQHTVKPARAATSIKQ